jgi:hypothetical protein
VDQVIHVDGRRLLWRENHGLFCIRIRIYFALFRVCIKIRIRIQSLVRISCSLTDCNFGAPRALRRSLSVIHSPSVLACRPGLTVVEPDSAVAVMESVGVDWSGVMMMCSGGGG